MVTRRGAAAAASTGTDDNDYLKGAKDEESADSDEEMKSENEEDDDEDTDESGSESDDAPPVELLCTSRSRRATAGNKMAQLMKEAIDEQEKDDFYKTTYDGLFLEDDQLEDQEFQEPVESDGDEVDSDFDRSEGEDEEESEEDVSENKPKKKKAYEDARNKSKKWVMARMGGVSVPANAVSEKQQQILMKEAENTEKENVQSLKKYEQFELEKKKKREKALIKHRVKPPFTKLTSTSTGTVLTIPEIRKFEKGVKPAIKHLCAVTGQPARYFDPVTQLPYSTIEAFKIIRKSYFEYLTTVEGNPEVDEYMAKFAT